MPSKITLIHFAYPPHIGGVETVLQEHAHLLAGFGYTVTVLTGSGKNTNPAITLKEIPEFQSLQSYNGQLQKKILEEGVIDEEFYALSGRIGVILEQELANQDVIIVHNILTIPRNLAFIHAFKKFVLEYPEKKYIAWTHDHFYVLEEKIRDIQTVSSSSFERDLLLTPIPGISYVVISETFKHLLCDLLKMPAASVTVVPNGINIERFLEIDSQILQYMENKKLLNVFPSYTLTPLLAVAIQIRPAASSAMW